ncbi:unnamed protein product [Merluccius merluccius]
MSSGSSALRLLKASASIAPTSAQISAGSPTGSVRCASEDQKEARALRWDSSGKGGRPIRRGTGGASLGTGRETVALMHP